MDLCKLEVEVDHNYDFFQRHMNDYLPTQLGRYALLRRCHIIGFFDNAEQAEIKGEQFGDGLYSIQLVDPAPVNLGLYSNG